MTTHFTNGDKILQAVLADAKLAELGEYTPTGIETIRCKQRGVPTLLRKKVSYKQTSSYIHLSY